MGTKGTCKTSLVQGLSRHLSQIVGDEEEEEEEGGGEVVIINYNVEKDGLEVSLRVRKRRGERKRGRRGLKYWFLSGEQKRRGSSLLWQDLAERGNFVELDF